MGNETYSTDTTPLNSSPTPTPTPTPIPPVYHLYWHFRSDLKFCAHDESILDTHLNTSAEIGIEYTESRSYHCWDTWKYWQLCGRCNCRIGIHKEEEEEEGWGGGGGGGFTRCHLSYDGNVL
ncbi:hypothetical protein N431DRAFT_139180 [Stipitochalara longipes BDJ]|nr:hypothetical protein N431DRAFT_139180 [Stipitochalara longipes BDJ]